NAPGATAPYNQKHHQDVSAATGLGGRNRIGLQPKERHCARHKNSPPRLWSLRSAAPHTAFISLATRPPSLPKRRPQRLITRWWTERPLRQLNSWLRWPTLRKSRNSPKRSFALAITNSIFGFP